MFAAVAAEAAGVLGVNAVSLLRYDPATQLFTKVYGTHGDRPAVPDGTQAGLIDCPDGIVIVRTGQPVRIDDWARVPGRSRPGTASSATVRRWPHRSWWTA